jgi:hypothetical protein
VSRSRPPCWTSEPLPYRPGEPMPLRGGPDADEAASAGYRDGASRPGLQGMSATGVRGMKLWITGGCGHSWASNLAAHCARPGNPSWGYSTASQRQGSQPQPATWLQRPRPSRFDFRARRRAQLPTTVDRARQAVFGARQRCSTSAGQCADDAPPPPPSTVDHRNPAQGSSRSMRSEPGTCSEARCARMQGDAAVIYSSDQQGSMARPRAVSYATPKTPDTLRLAADQSAEDLRRTRALDFHSPYGLRQGRGGADQYLLDSHAIFGLKNGGLFRHSSM